LNCQRVGVELILHSFWGILFLIVVFSSTFRKVLCVARRAELVMGIKRKEPLARLFCDQKVNIKPKPIHAAIRTDFFTLYEHIRKMVPKSLGDWCEKLFLNYIEIFE